jgi:hypothetical protein
MNPRFHLIPVLILGWLAYLLVARHSSPAPSSPADIPTGQPESVSNPPAPTEYALELSRLSAEQGKREQAAAKTKSCREDLQVATMVPWSNVISNNWPAFQALRRQAAAAPTRTTPCTLCDSKGYMGICVLCRNRGKCPTCAGTGKARENEYCPSCLGTGKCYLCFGTGKMPCPFCDDGMITLKWPFPPKMMPVH